MLSIPELWFKSTRTRRPSRKANPPRSRNALSLESLDQRVVPATHTWSGGGTDSLWSDASNWTGGAPTVGEANVILVFPSVSSNLATTTDNLAGLTVDQIQLSGSGYSIQGSGTGTVLNLSGAVSPSINDSVGGNTFAAGLSINLLGTATIEVDNGVDTISSTVTSSGTFGLDKTGNGTLTLATSATYLGSTVVGAGTLKLTPQQSTVGTASYTTLAGNYSFTPAANDVLSGLVPVLVSNPSPGVENSGSAGVLTDGTVGPTSGANNGARYTVGDNASLTYQLPQEPAGFDLTQINLYTIWNDPGRSQISIANISYSTFENPTEFIPIPNSSVNYVPDSGTTDTNMGLASLTAAGGVLASGVVDLQFNFGPQENDYVGYGELEAVGTPSNLSSLPINSPVTVAHGATLDLNGSTPTVGSLSDATPGSGGSVINSSATPAVLLLDNSGSTTFSGSIGGGNGTLGLFLEGTGTTTLAGINTYSGATTINGGTLTLGNNLAIQNSTVSIDQGATLVVASGVTAPTLGGLAGTGNVVLATSGTTLTVGSDNQNTTYFGLLTGGYGFTKVGTGTLTIGSMQSYSGPTLVDGGDLKLSGETTTTVAASLHTFTSDAASGIGTAGFGTSDYTDALAFDQGTNLNINGVTFIDTGTAQSGTNWSVNNWDTFNASGNFPGGFQPASGTTNSLLNHFAYYGAGYGTQTLTITGLTPGQFYDARIYYRSWGNPVDSRSVNWTFDPGVGAPTTIEDLNEDANSTGNYIDLTYTAGPSGTLTLSAQDLNQGNSWHLYGFTNQSITGVLPDTTAVEVMAGATLDLNGVKQPVASLSGSGTVTDSNTAASTLALATAGTATFAGSIGGPINLVMNGTGTETLAGGSTYTVGTTVNTGTLTAANPSALGTGTVSLDGGKLGVGGTPAQQLIVSSYFDDNYTNNNIGGVYTYNPTTGAQIGTLVAPNGNLLDGPASLALAPDGNLFISSQFNNQILEYNFATGNLTTALDLSTFVPPSGGPAGTFQPAGIAFSPDGKTLYVAQNGGQTSFPGTAVYSFPFDPTTDTVNANEPTMLPIPGLLNPSGLTFGPDGALYISNFSASFIGSPEVIRYDPATESWSSFVPASPVSGISLQTPNGLTFGPDGDLYVTDLSAFGGSGEIVQYTPNAGSGGGVSSAVAVTPAETSSDPQPYGAPPGNLTNQFPSGVTFDASGRLLVANLGGGDFPNAEGSVYAYSPVGTFSSALIEGGIYASDLISYSRLPGQTRFTLPNNIVINSPASDVIATGGADSSAILSGSISGAGPLTIDAASTGTLTLTGSNSYGGGTIVDAGTIVDGGSDSVPSGSPLTVAAGATFEFSGNAVSVSSLGGSGLVTNSNALPATLTIATPSGVSTFGGALEDGTGGGSLAVTESGPGTEILSGANTFTGPTTISGGYLAVYGPNGTLAASSTVTVGSASTLAGDGTVAGTINVSGTLATDDHTLIPGPGGEGILSTGPVNFASGSTFDVSIAGNTAGSGGYSQIRSTGAVNLGQGIANLDLSDATYSPASTDSFTVVTATGGVRGFFNGYPAGSTVTANGQSFTINYGSNNVVLTPVSQTLQPPTLTTDPVLNSNGLYLDSDGGLVTSNSAGTISYVNNPQRSLVTSLTVSFSGPVTIAPGAFTLTRQSDGNAITDNNQITVTNPLGDHQTYILTFADGASPIVQSGSLADGLYVLNINHALVTAGLSGTGPTMTADYNSPTSGPDRIYRLFGDYNGDGSVNGADFGNFSSAYNSGPNDPNYQAYLDYSNANNGINSADFTQFSDRYGTAI